LESLIDNSEAIHNVDDKKKSLPADNKISRLQHKGDNIMDCQTLYRLNFIPSIKRQGNIGSVSLKQLITVIYVTTTYIHLIIIGRTHKRYHDNLQN
jgi:hypothetical protein